MGYTTKWISPLLIIEYFIFNFNFFKILLSLQMEKMKKILNKDILTLNDMLTVTK
jgi:hypothetical protein